MKNMQFGFKEVKYKQKEVFGLWNFYRQKQSEKMTQLQTGYIFWKRI